MKRSEKNVHLSFVQFINYFIKDAKLYNRHFWTEVLGVSNAAISQWLKAKTTPKPKQLNRIYSIVSESIDENTDLKTAKKDFATLLDEPLNERSKKKFKNQNTIGDYMLRPKKEQLNQTLDALPFQLKNEIILATTRLCHSAAMKVNAENMNINQVLDLINKLNIELEEVKEAPKVKKEKNTRININNPSTIYASGSTRPSI